jgi:hypothetical protein
LLSRKGKKYGLDHKKGNIFQLVSAEVILVSNLEEFLEFDERLVNSGLKSLMIDCEGFDCLEGFPSV